MAEPGKRRCPNCEGTKPASEFYENCSECKACKRARSRGNRAMQARKIAAFERFVDVLIVIADRAADPPAECSRKAVA